MAKSKSIATPFVSTSALGVALAFSGSVFAQAKPKASPAATAPAAAVATAPAAAVTAAPVSQISTAADRKSVSITVYNQNFGVVREVRELGALGTGTVSLEFRDVAANIQPQTVAIKSLTAPGAISVLEQNYRYDLLTPQTLLENTWARRSARTAITRPPAKKKRRTRSCSASPSSPFCGSTGR